jgi:hypothetical protein
MSAISCSCASCAATEGQCARLFAGRAGKHPRCTSSPDAEGCSEGHVGPIRAAQSGKAILPRSRPSNEGDDVHQRAAISLVLAAALAVGLSACGASEAVEPESTPQDRARPSTRSRSTTAAPRSPSTPHHSGSSPSTRTRPRSCCPSVSRTASSAPPPGRTPSSTPSPTRTPTSRAWPTTPPPTRSSSEPTRTS